MKTDPTSAAQHTESSNRPPSSAQREAGTWTDCC